MPDEVVFHVVEDVDTIPCSYNAPYVKPAVDEKPNIAPMDTESFPTLASL